MNVGVLLAAGASRRVGSPKALVSSEGETFLVQGVRNLWAACDAVVVVLGSSAARVQRSVEREFERAVASGQLARDLATAERLGAKGLEVRFVVHAGWRRGMLSSARAGLVAALELKPGAVLLMPVDQPAVRPATVRGLAGAMDAALSAYRGKGARARFPYALIPRNRGRRGHPIALSAALARAILADRGGADLSDTVRRSARLVGYLDVADPGVVQNRNRG